MRKTVMGQLRQEADLYGVFHVQPAAKRSGKINLLHILCHHPGGVQCCFQGRRYGRLGFLYRSNIHRLKENARGPVKDHSSVIKSGVASLADETGVVYNLPGNHSSHRIDDPGTAYAARRIVTDNIKSDIFLSQFDAEDGALFGPHAAPDMSTLESRSGRSCCHNDLVIPPDRDLGVGSNIDNGTCTIAFMAGGKYGCQAIASGKATDKGQKVDGSTPACWKVEGIHARIKGEGFEGRGVKRWGK